MGGIEFRAFPLQEIETRVKDETGFVSALVSESGVYEPDFGTTFMEGAWRRTLDAHGGSLALLWMHQMDVPVGLGPFRESRRGLELEDGEIDLTVETGRMVYSGIQRRYIDTMSQGFRTLDWKPDPDTAHARGSRLIYEVRLFEGSFVTRGFQGNPGAKIEQVRQLAARVGEAMREGDEKRLQGAVSVLVGACSWLDCEVRRATPFADLPLASADRAWDAGAARKRVADWAGDDMAKYRKAFLWYDAENADNLTAYKFPIADVIDGGLKAVPRAIYAAAGRIDQADIDDVDGVKRHIERYYAKLGEEAPWKRSAVEVPNWLAQEIQELHALLEGNGSPRGTRADENALIEEILVDLRAFRREYVTG